jgi:hypothetical protein
VKNRDIVKDIVHQVYTKESNFQKMKAMIGRSVGGMALAISQIAQGCASDPKVTVESQ